MNNNLDINHFIVGADLNSEFYFQSLLEQAHSKGLLSDEAIERLQLECLNLLAYKVEHYNAGDSSSIQIEKAQNIMTSNLFTIGLWLKTCSSPDDALNTLQNEPINNIYEKGLKRIHTMLLSTKAVYARLLDQLVTTENVFYRATITEGIKVFFKLYNPDYAAHEIHITADYPVYHPLPELAGIEFIQAYVNGMFYENLFCSLFSAEDIHHLLCGYDPDYRMHVINIYEPVLLTAACCIIAGANTRQLHLSESSVTYLSRLFAAATPNEILETISKAVDELNLIFQFPHGLMQYIMRSLPLIASKIELAAQEKIFTPIFFTPVFPENEPKFIFYFGDKMDDSEYRKIIAEIRQCRFSQDRVAVIKEHIHSLADMEDLLLDAELTGEEIQAVFNELGWPEIAALAKKYLPFTEIDMLQLREGVPLLAKSLGEFISALPPIQQELITKAVRMITEE